MAHSHGGHDHSHGHQPANYNRAFMVGIGLNVAFVLVEGAFGFWANSMALVADAGHNLSDVLGLLLAWGASYLGQQPPSPRRTYGLRRSSILAALLNAVLLLLAIGGIAWESLQRFVQPQAVSALLVIAVGAVGVVINTATALLFMSGRTHDLNIRGAYLHMAADAGVSAAVVAAGLAIRLTGWGWIDPAASLLVVVVIAIGTWGLLRESLDLALDAVPAGINPAEVEAWLASRPGITSIHDLHIWGMSTTEVALSAHLIKPDGRLDDAFLQQIADELHDKFGIQHCTIQLEEAAEHSCDLMTRHAHKH